MESKYEKYFTRKTLYWVVLFSSMVILFFIFFYKPNKQDKFVSNVSNVSNPEINKQFICAFDIDNTLTCGIQQAAKAISACKEYGAKIAIITARPTPWYSDLNLKDLGLTESDFIDDFYHGEEFNCSFTDKDCFEKSISSTKVKHLKMLVEKYNTEANRIIFFDDQYSNIQAAIKEGFSTIYANHDLCGIPPNADINVKKIFSIIEN